MENINNLFVWAADKVESTLVPYELVWWDIVLPIRYIYSDWLVNHQWLDDNTKYCCVFFWEANSINEIRNKLKLLKPLGEVKWEHISNYAERIWRLDRKSWALLIDWPKTSKDLGLIDWYAQCNTIDDVKKALVEQWPIWVWSNKIDWKYTMNSPYIVREWKSYWHKFIIVWYDDEKRYFICENSYWKELFDNWRFYLKYENFNLLFNTKTANFINDNRFKLLDEYLKLTKSMSYKKFYEVYIKGENNNLKLWLKKLAAQIRYIKKINSKELLELIK